MAFDFAEALGRVRRVVQDTFGLNATYSDKTLAEPVRLRVRWHYKQMPVGDVGDGYPAVLDLVEKVIFDKEELLTKGVTVVRGGRVKFLKFSDVELVIDTQEESDGGPVDEAWLVGKLHNGGLTT